jgi:protein-disulfide isomerase
MSSDDSNVPAQRDRREAVREKAQLVQARHARLSRIRLAVLLTGAVIVVAAVGETDGGFAITSVAGVALGSATIPDAAATASGEDAAETPEPTPTPTSESTADIRVYVDYLAPGAKQFELANASQLSGWVTEGAATLSYYPVAMLTAKSNGTKYSLRAAGAAACVASHSPDKVFAFNHALLDAQPDANSDGLSDADLATLAQTSGVTDPKGVRSCIEGGEYMAWAKTATDQAVAGIPDTDGLTLTGTPMILVNGEQYQGALDDPKEFAQFVLTTASDAYYNSPTATPTPAS